MWKYFFVIPHAVVYMTLSSDTKRILHEDVAEMNRRTGLKKNLFFYLVNKKPYRNLFYYRVGVVGYVLRIFLHEYELFFISKSVKNIGGGIFVLNHPYGTILNCKSIGKNFTVCQLTTVGNARHGRNDLIPIIGDNVSVGSNVNIIGKIRIGNNVIIGAGSVVVKDVPDNCVVAGNPAKIIRSL